jgi:hypothetical protein
MGALIMSGVEIQGNWALSVAAILTVFSLFWTGVVKTEQLGGMCILLFKKMRAKKGVSFVTQLYGGTEVQK